MLLSLSIIGIILSVILLSFSARKYKSAIYLSGFFFTMSFQGFIIYVLTYSKSVLLLSLFLINFTFLLYLIGPLFYWYIRSTLTDNVRLRKRDLLHLLPSLIFLITSFQYIFTPYSYKIQVANEFINNIDKLILNQPPFLHQIFSHRMIFLSLPLLVLGYVLWTAVLLIRYLVQRKELSVFFGQRYLTTWLSTLIGSLFIFSVSYLLALDRIYTAANATLFYTLNLLQVLSCLGLAGLLISPFFFPRILYGLPRFPETNINLNLTSADKGSSHTELIKHKSNFESDYLAFIHQKAELCMKEVQPYLQPDFNLTHLSFHTQIPVHHLSYYFREEKKQHFNDFRNEWRINHAKNLIRKGKANELTLETIGLLSGFSTRNTFLTTFKKVEGITPSTFAAQQKN